MKKSNPQVQNYIQTKLNYFIEPLVYQMVVQRPLNPLKFAIEWLALFAQKQLQKQGEMNSDTQSQCQDQVKQLQAKIAGKKAHHSHHKSRIGISQQVFGQFNLREDIVLEENLMNQNQKILVKSLVRSSILFQNLDSKDQQILLKAFRSRETEEYQLIIKQGEAGNILYIVQAGEYDCYKLIDGENIFVKTYFQGEAFGELALMYNAPRAASIVTKIPGKLLMLDRCTFSQVLKVAALRKQQIIKGAIDKLQILKEIPLQQKHQLITILKEQKIGEGEYVIREGEEGNKFYIVLQGTLVAEKKEGYELPKVVFKYQVGDYFGELALINNSPRKASVKAMNSAKVAVIQREGFKRVFGKIQQSFKQKSQKYHS